MRQNLLFTIGVVALLGAGALVSMQDPPKPVPVDWVTVEFNAENCDTDGFKVSWRTEYSSGVGGYVVSGVLLSGVTWFCLKQDITVYLNSLTDGTGGTVLAWAVVDGSSGVTSIPYEREVFFNFGDAHVSAKSINAIAVAIPDRTDTDTFGVVRDLTSGAPVATMVYGSNRVYVAGRTVRGAEAPVDVTVDPAGGIIFWYCYGASSIPSLCREGSAGTILLSDASAGTPVTSVVGVVPTVTADSSTLTPPLVGYYLFRSRFVTSDYIYYGSEDSGGSGGAQMTLQVTKAPTTTTFTASATSATWGTPLTFTGTVAENVGPELSQPAGTIVFMNGGVAFGSCEVTNNTCSYTTGSLNALPVGTRSITAKYVDVTSGARANYLDSPVSGARSISIAKSDSTTGIEVASSSVYLSPVTITARVRTKSPSIGIPTGTLVTFRDYTSATGTAYTSIGSCTLVADIATTSGVCSIVTSSLAVRDHYLSAVFAATTNVNTSLSGRSVLSVIVPSTTLTLTPTPGSPSEFGQPVQFAVAVSSNGGTVPAAVVTFTDTTSGGTRTLGTCTLSSAACSITTSALEATGHTIAATYPGTSSIPSADASIPYVVGKGDVTSTLSASTTAAVVGQPITFTARVAPVRAGAPTPTGTVTFYREGAVEVDTCQLVSGACSITIVRAASGTDGIWATYQGSASYLSKSSSTLAFRIAPAGTTTSGSWTPATITYGTAASLTVRVAAISPSTSVPTGTVAISDGTTGIGSCTLADGACTIAWPDTGVAWPSAGAHTLNFRYLGTSDFSSSTQARSLTIARANTTIDLSSNTGGYTLVLPAITRNSSLTFGTIVASSVPATLARPLGTATFRMTSSTGTVTTLGTKTLVARTATTSWADYTYKFTKAGTYRMWVVYTPATVSNFNGSTLSSAYWIVVTVQ